MGMQPMATRALLRAAVEKERRGRQEGIAYGEVTVTSPLTVAFNGTENAAAIEGVIRLSSYTPALNDIVIMIRVGPAWVAIGSVV